MCGSVVLCLTDIKLYTNQVLHFAISIPHRRYVQGIVEGPPLFGVVEQYDSDRLRWGS